MQDKHHEQPEALPRPSPHLSFLLLSFFFTRMRGCRPTDPGSPEDRFVGRLFGSTRCRGFWRTRHAGLYSRQSRLGILGPSSSAVVLPYPSSGQPPTKRGRGVTAIISPNLSKGSEKLKYIASHSLPARLAEEPLPTRLARFGRDPKRKETKMKREKLQNKRNAEKM